MHLTMHPLQIPLFNGLARVFACKSGSTWVDTGVACFGASHLAVVVVGTLMLLAAWVFTFIGGWLPISLQEAFGWSSLRVALCFAVAID